MIPHLINQFPNWKKFTNRKVPLPVLLNFQNLQKMRSPKFIPILYSTPMVQAIDENRKNQTRRTKGLENINKNPDMYQYNGNLNAFGEKPIDKLYHWFEEIDADGNPNEMCTNIKCPYGQVGDVLWVKETHFQFGIWMKNGRTKTGKQKWKFVRDKTFTSVAYKDKPPVLILNNTNRQMLGWFVRSSLFMPKEACRFFLKITNIRCERLHDISEKDAISEGIISLGSNGMYKNYMDDGLICKPILSFGTLWQKINGIPSYCNNPWVWVITFEKIAKPENFI